MSPDNEQLPPATSLSPEGYPQGDSLDAPILSMNVLETGLMGVDIDPDQPSPNSHYRLRDRFSWRALTHNQQHKKLTTSLLIIIILLLVGLLFLVWRYGGHTKEVTYVTPQEQTSDFIRGMAPSKKVYQINGQLRVDNKSTLGALQVKGPSTFGSDVSIGGALVVGGRVVATNMQGSVTGSLQGTFVGTGNGTFGGGFNGTASGTFSGDGSGLTGITAQNCPNCVRLQNSVDSPQTGSISIDGTYAGGAAQLSGGLTAASGAFSGSIAAQRLSIRSMMGGISVQDGAGTSIFGVDSAARTVRVQTLLPQVAASTIYTAANPGVTVDRRQTQAFSLPSGYVPGISSVMVKGKDGLARYVVVGVSTSTSSSALFMVRCTDDVCGGTVITQIEDAMPYDPYSTYTGVDAAVGSDGYLRIVYSDDLGGGSMYLVRCLDQDCASTTSTQLQSNPSFAEGLVLFADNTAGVLYARLANPGTYPSEYSSTYLKCGDLDCTTQQSTDMPGVTQAAIVMPGDLVLSPNGLPVMTYVEYDSNSSQSNAYLVLCTTATCSTNTRTLIPHSTPSVVSKATLAIGPDGHARVLTQGYDTTAYDSYTVITLCHDNTCSQPTTRELPELSLAIIPATMQVMADGTAWIMGYNDQGQMVLAVCNDASCSSTRVETADAQGALPSSYLANDGRMEVGYVSWDDSSIVHMKMPATGPLLEYEVGKVDASAVPGPSISIGSTLERFGQIFLQDANIETADGLGGLSVNRLYGGLPSDIVPSLATFSTNGQIRTAIGGNGNITIYNDGNVDPLKIIDTNGQIRTAIGGNGNITIYNDGNVDPLKIISSAGLQVLSVDSSGVLNLNAGVSSLQPTGNGTDVSILQGYDGSGNVSVRIKADGGIVSGRTDCTGCQPETLSSTVDIQLDNAYYRGVQYENYLYVSTNTQVNSQSHTGAMVVYDVSNPAVPKRIGAFGAGKGAWGELKIVGRYGYVPSLDPGNEVLLFDMTNPAAPKLLKTIPTSHSDEFDIEVVDTRMYVLSRMGIDTFDITDPANPLLIHYLALPNEWGNVSIAFVNGVLAVRNTDYSTLQIISLANPDVPALVTIVPTGSGSRSYADMVKAGNYLYIPQGLGRAFTIADMNEPTQPILASVQASSGSSKTLYLDGSTLYALGYGMLDRYDISAPDSPVLIDTMTTPNYEQIYAVGSAVYAVNDISKTLSVYTADSVSSLQNVQARDVGVSGSVNVGGSLQVANGVGVQNSNLTVMGLETPRITGHWSGQGGGSLLGDGSVTYYYRVAYLDQYGREGPASPEYAVPSGTMSPISSLFYFGQVTPGGAGALTGTYQYVYNVETALGASTPSGPSSPVTVAGQEVVFNGLYLYPNDQITKVNLYRCQLPACSSYQLVGSRTGPFDSTILSMTDDNPTPSAVTPPTVNTARTNTNMVFIRTNTQTRATKVKLYRSTTKGSGYSYQILDPSGDLLYDQGDLGTVGSPLMTDTTGRVGIGTLNPEARLHVEGTALFRSQEDEVNALSIQNVAKQAVFTADTQNMRIGIGTSTPQSSLQISSSNNSPLLLVSDTTAPAQDVLMIADGGATTFRNQTNSSSAFSIQNAAGASLFSVSTANAQVQIAGGVDLKFAGSGNVRNALTKDYACSAAELVNDIVAVSGAGTVGRTVTANSNRVAGVVVAKPNATTCTVAFSGAVQVWFSTNASPSTIGDPVITSAIGGAAQSTTNPAAGSMVGVSTSSKDGVNLVWVLLRGN
ncbi:hypothetical protein KBC77_03785 [Candidatus Saccharibacteria bacterium]|nr:hypothetical protein [Candidatus Saccharibacteria bacterium]